MFTDISPTPYDLRFSVAGIPVRVHPFFWLLTLFLFIGLQLPPIYVFLWAPVVFVSILVHEMGHALVVKGFGWRPEIVLYSFGGLAIYRPTYYNPRKQMLISLAGPAAGFALAGIVVLVLRATGIGVDFTFGLPGFVDWDYTRLDPAANPPVLLLIAARFLLQVNIYWGLLNLLPIYPLDGGQFTRELMSDLGVPDPVVKSLVLSLMVAAGAGIYVYSRLHDPYMALWFGYFAYNSYAMLQAYSGRGGGYGGY